ncbi:hypothetical protein FisN_27Lh094 [Fistulifera solaris]|uniref:SET domain-containing protein n=1 Tax=Fistulifera solaris TaxID=1519565 RepID=A0A1Z5KAN0_FISSO|nr:hypothetical protein FisN_27Lh094 [Fistulifera solaris]|eukprot:GAX23320.1 hypothetical protein FisN_27Lh094 [Fistulifera solaris]
MNQASSQASLSNEAKDDDDDDEDPFAVFGDDDEDDEDDEDEIPSTTATAPLAVSRPPIISQHQTHDEFDAIEFVPQQILLHDAEPLPSIPSWPDPLYRKKSDWEIVTTQSYGRAVRATQPIKAGTLLLIEKPLWDLVTTSNKDARMQSPTDVLYQGVQWLLEQEHNNPSLLQYVEHLHPTLEQVERVLNSSTSDTLTQSERDQIADPMEQLQHDTRLQQLAATWEDSITVRRYYLLLQYNLLRTGLYLYVALWNHQHQTPNCIKLGNQIWTCRSVEPHEMLTMDYVPEISSRRAAIVWEHHKFRVPTHPGPAWIPRYEVVLQEFQEQYQLLVAEPHPATQHLEWAMVLEQAMLELLTDNKESSVDNETDSFLWIPCRLLYLQVGQYLLSSSTTTTSTASSSFQLTNQSRIALLERLLQQTQVLLHQQQHYYGPDHLHLATTYDELAQLCHYLVQQDPSTFHAKVSAMESMYLKQHERIRLLYPDITDDNLMELVASRKE